MKLSTVDTNNCQGRNIETNKTDLLHNDIEYELKLCSA